MKTQGEIEAAICEGMSRFEQDYMGRGPKDIHAHLLGDLLVVRLRGGLTVAEQQLSKSLPAEKGRDLLKQVRPHLIETARPVMEALVQEVTGVKALSLHHDISTRLHAAMDDHGVDAMILLMNDNVVYATGASWPVLDAGLSHVERPVAIVLGDDAHPHLFLPFRSGSALKTQVPQSHLHEALYLELDEGVDQFARVVADLIAPGARVAVDEMTGAMRRAADRIFPGGPPSDAAVVIGASNLVKTPDQIINKIAQYCARISGPEH